MGHFGPTLWFQFHTEFRNCFSPINRSLKTLSLLGAQSNFSEVALITDCTVRSSSGSLEKSSKSDSVQNVTILSSNYEAVVPTTVAYL